MKANNKNVALLTVSIILAILVVALSAVMGILITNGTLISIFSVFEMMFIILTYGFGAIILVYGKTGLSVTPPPVEI